MTEIGNVDCSVLRRISCKLEQNESSSKTFFTCMDFVKPSDGARFDLLCVPVQHLPVLKHIPFPRGTISVLSVLPLQPTDSIFCKVRSDNKRDDVQSDRLRLLAHFWNSCPNVGLLGAANKSASLWDLVVCYVVNGDISG